MTDKLTEFWAWIVAAFIYVIFVWTVISYFGEIVLWVQELMYG